MASSKLRLMQKTFVSDLPLCRSRPRLSDEPPQVRRSLDSNSEAVSPVGPKPAKLSPSPYTQSQLRSHSVTKARYRGTQTKPRFLVKDRLPPSLSFVKSAAVFARDTPVLASHLPTDSARDQSALNQTVKDLPSELANLSFNSSFASVHAHASESPKVIRLKRPESALKAIETAFNTAIRQLDGKNNDENREMAIYQQTFADIIAVFPTGKTLLQKIKAKYESWLSRGLANSLKLRNQLKDLEVSLMQEVEEKAVLVRKMEKLARENVDLSRGYSEIQEKCEEFQGKLSQIANMKLDGFPPTEDAWRLVLAELESYKAWKTKVLKQQKAASSKEQKLLGLIRALRQRGYPVEDVYNEDVRMRLIQKQSTRAPESEGETLVQGPTKSLPRPDLVPSLQLEAVGHDLTSDSASSATYEESLRQAVCSPQKQPVPKLTIPIQSSSEHSFQAEFMARYNEFSESWRHQIDAMGR